MVHVCVYNFLFVKGKKAGISCWMFTYKQGVEYHAEICDKKLLFYAENFYK
jgi:hypothetical protein